jgi:bacterioferritin
MQGDPKIIDFLNRAIRAELTAVDEYFLESRLLSNWGFKKLAHCLWRDYKKDHRKQARKFIDRVLFLGGSPAMTPETFTAGSSVDGIFAAGLAAEMSMRAIYTEATQASENAEDWVSEEMFTDALVDIERRIKKIETQISLIASVGLELYSQKKI